MEKALEIFLKFKYQDILRWIGVENMNGTTQLKDGRPATVRVWSGEGYTVSLLFDEKGECLRT